MNTFWYTHTVVKEVQAQAFTEYLNTIDDDIKWMTEGEVQQEIEVKVIYNGRLRR